MKYISAVCARVLIAVCIVLTPSLAAAQGVYLKLDVGYSDADFFSIVRGDNNADGGFHTKESFEVDAGTVYSVALGTRLFGRIRGELEASHHSGFGVREQFSVFGEALESRARLNSTGLFLNGYYELPRRTFSPYIGAGFGCVRNEAGEIRNALRAAPDVSFAAEGASATSFAWQAVAGVTIAAGARFSVDLSYHYRDLGGDMRIDNVVGVSYSPYTTGDFKTRDLRLGLMYRF